MEELFQLIEKNGDVTEPEIHKGIYEEHQKLGLMLPDEIPIRLHKIFAAINNIKSDKIRNHLQLYTLILSLIVFPKNVNFLNFSFNLQNEQILWVFITHILRKQIKLPVPKISTIFYKSVDSISVENPFYLIRPIYYYQRVPDLLKCIENLADTKPFIQNFLNTFLTYEDLNEINHSTILYFNCIMQQIISYLMKFKDENIIQCCNTFFSRIFSIQSVSPSIILLQFLHLWYIFARICIEKDIKIPNDQLIHLISDLFRRISTSKKHELHRFFHWNLVVTIRSRFPNPLWEFNSLCVILTFYKTIYHIESMKDMIDPSQNFLDQTLEQSKNKVRFSFCTFLSYFESCFIEHANSIREFYLLTVDHNLIKESDEMVEAEPKITKLTFSKQLEYSKSENLAQNFKLFDDFLCTIMKEKSLETSNFSGQFERFISNCEFMKTKIVTARYFLFPSFLRALNNFDYLPYTIHIVKTLIKVVNHLNQGIFAIQYIKIVPNRNLDIQSIIDSISKVLSDIPQKIVPYFSITIAKILFKETKKMRIMRSTIDFLSTLPKPLFISMIKDMIQIILSNKVMFFSDDFESTFFICRFMILTLRLFSISKYEELSKDLIPVLNKSILRSIFSNIRKISNQSIVFKTIGLIVKFFNLDSTCFTPKVSYFEDISEYAKKDFLYPFISLLPKTCDSQKVVAYNTIFEYALKFGDQDSINIASKHCMNIFSNKEKHHISNEYHYINLYQAWKNANLTNEDRDVMIQTIPFYSEAFISKETKVVHDTLCFNDIYQSICNSINNNPDSVIIAFTVFKNSILKPDLTLEEAKSLINILMRCYTYKFMIEKVDKFIPSILNYHSKLFLEEQSNVFFLSLLDVSSGSISYIANSMRDMGIAFIEIVLSQDPDCRMIQETINQILYVFPKKERIYSLLSLISILLRCCPKFVSIELFRILFNSSNDVFLYDYSFNQSIREILNKYVNSIDQETTQKFCEMLFNLFGTVPISFRIPILEILSKIDADPPDYDIYKESKFKYLELQKVMISLIYNKNITPPIVEFTKKNILEKNEVNNQSERLSRRISLIYSMIINKDTFSNFTEDQSFTIKIANILSNSMAAGFRELRKEAKNFFLIYFSRIESEKKLSFISDQFTNPVDSKIISFFGDRIEKILYFKRLMKIKPDLIQVKFILEIIQSIGLYVTKTENEKSRYLPNLKIFFDFLGTEKINKVQGLEEGISTNAMNHLSYFTYFVESFYNLLISLQYPYYTIIAKPSFNFLIKFPDKTLKCMIDSSQGSQLYPFYLSLLDFENATPFHLQFIALCKLKQDPFYYPLHYFEVIAKMCTIKSCVENQDFLDLIDFIFSQIITRFNNITNHSFFMLFRMISALTKTFKFVEDINRFISLLSSLDLPLVINSSYYHLIVKRCIKNTSQKFRNDLISYLINNKGIVKTLIFDNALQHTIKESKEIPDYLIDNTWIFLADSKYPMSCCRLLSHKVPSDEIIDKVNEISKDCVLSSCTESIINSIKLMIKLDKYGKLHADAYWLYIKQCLFIFKFMDIPFSRYTFIMLKLMRDHFTEVPQDIKDSLSLFIHSKVNSIRETQRIIEILLFAPPLNQVCYFSPITIISSFLEAKMPQLSKLPPKPSFDCILKVGIKYIKDNEVQKDISDRFFFICYKYLELTVCGMPYSNFIEHIFIYINDGEAPIPPQSLLNAISDDNNDFLLPSFASFYIFLKLQPDIFINYHPLIEKSLNFIKKSTTPINPITLKSFIGIVCREQKYLESVYQTYNALKNSKKVDQRIYQIIYSIMKSNVLNNRYEEMWNYLMKMEEKQAYLYLNESEQIRYTKFIFKNNENNELFIIQSTFLFLDNETVSKDAKVLLISNLALFVNHSNSELVLKCIEKIEKFGNSIGNHFLSEIADILIESARCSNYLNKLKCIRKLGLLAPTEIEEKLDFVFNYLPYQSWRDETMIFVLSIFATDLKKWLPIFAFGNSYKSFVSDFVVYFLRPLLNEETIRLFSDFFSNILSIDNKTYYNGIINGLCYIFYSTEFPIHPKIFLKAENLINQPVYLTGYLDDLSAFSDNPEYFLPHFLNDFLFGKFGCNNSIVERAAMSLTLLSKFNTAVELYSQIENNEKNSLFNLYRDINDNENRFWSFILSNKFDFEIPVELINKTSMNFESHNFSSIESLLNQAHQKLLNTFQLNRPFFKDELFVSIQSAIQIEKYLIHKSSKDLRVPKLSLDSLSFMQSLNPFLLSMLSNFRDEIKSILKLPQRNPPEIEYDENSPPIFSVPPLFVKKFRKISGITTQGLFAVNAEQIKDYLSLITTISQISSKEVIKLSPILFEIFRISPNDDNYKAVFYSYSYLVNRNIDIPIFIRQQAGARLLFLLQVANCPSHYDVICEKASIFEHKSLDIWRLWLNQLVILSKTKELKEQLMPLYIEMGYRTLLYARKMNLKDIEYFLNHKIPPSLIPLAKLGEALDIIFQDKEMEINKESVVTLINQSLPFNFPLYHRSQMMIFRLSGDIKYLSDQLVVLTLSTTMNSYTPILFQRCINPNSDKNSCATKTFSNIMHMMNIVMNSSYPTRIRNMNLCSPFVFEVGDNYLLTVMNGQVVYIKELFDQYQEMCNSKLNSSFANENEGCCGVIPRFIAQRNTKYEFVRNKNAILRSYSAHAAARHIFSVGYQFIEKMVLYIDPGAAPILTFDYEDNFLKREIQESSIRYSPNFYNLFGGEVGVPVFQIGIAAAACSFVDHLESIRSFLEVLFFDRLHYSKEKNGEEEDEELDDLLKVFTPIIIERNQIEERILDLAPPSGIAASPEDLTNWMSNMDLLMEKAMNVEIQPPLAFPWF